MKSIQLALFPFQTSIEEFLDGNSYDPDFKRDFVDTEISRYQLRIEFTL